MPFSRPNRRPKKFYRPIRLEHLEPRWLLNGSRLDEYDVVSPAWFAAARNASTASDAAQVGTLSGATGGGAFDSNQLPVDRWIVRLTAAATAELDSVGQAESRLDAVNADFQVIRGLGLPGQVLVRSFAPADATRAALAANPHVACFEADSVVWSQQTPNDPDFSSMTNLHNVGQFGATPDADIDAPEAWEMNTGSASVVVGVIDSGIDATHPDLYLNIWLNQGEIPDEVMDRIGEVDVDPPASAPGGKAGDGLITFYDLNKIWEDESFADQDFIERYVKDFNKNHYIDALDLLRNPRWADGRDTDGNAFVDDFFGWNFRTASDEPFAPNDPRDVLGHGTHVAGTIGAIGNNGPSVAGEIGRGVTGINWRSSIMALKFLDDRGQGNASEAVAAINYATMMRNRAADRVNVRVLNNSWGPVGFSVTLRNEIELAGAAGILFVAAAGNGNVLGQGMNIDVNPFYPASYDSDHLISVAATGPDDRLARFSNFGSQSVDIAAPGVGILSTFPGGLYKTANGTSMATPHVAGVAALIWSEVPEATVAEVRKAILDGADVLPDLQGRFATQGRLNAFNALDSDDFAPTARVVNCPDVTNVGAQLQTIIVEYTDRKKIDEGSLDDDDIVVKRQWGPRDELSAVLASYQLSSDGKQVTALYQVAAPGGTWDPLDYGEYTISVVGDQVRSLNGLAVPAADLGSFGVRIADPSIIVVDTFDDAADGLCAVEQPGKCTLRAAIQEANAAGAPRTILLPPGTYRLTIPGIGEDLAARGDLDVRGQITIIGDSAETTVIDATGIDRVLDVHADASLSLQRLRVTNGATASGDADGGHGGGILSRGTLVISDTTICQNAVGGRGGGIAVLAGAASVVRSTIAENPGKAHSRGGGVYVEGSSVVSIETSTISHNYAHFAGGLYIAGALQVTATNTTISNNSGLWFASGVEANNSSVTLEHVTVANNTTFIGTPGVSGPAKLHSALVVGNVEGYTLSGSKDVSGVVSLGYNLVGGVTNSAGFFAVGDQVVPNAQLLIGPLQMNGGPTETHALLPGSTAIDAGDPLSFPQTDQRGLERPTDGTGNNWQRPDIGAIEQHHAQVSGLVFWDRDRDGKRTADEPGLSDTTVYIDANHNGRLEDAENSVSSLADDPITVGDNEGGRYSLGSVEPDAVQVQIAVPVGWERIQRPTELVSLATSGAQGFGISRQPELSADGRFVAFTSLAANLTTGDDNGNMDVFVFDRQNRQLEIVSADSAGQVHSGRSSAPSLSYDGSLVAFESSSNLAPADENGLTDIYLYDRQTDTVQLITGGNGASSAPSISGDGRLVVFKSAADDLVLGDENGFSDIFLYDRSLEKIQRISEGLNAVGGNGNSFSPRISGDGQFIAFTSDANNLVPGDDEGCADVFLYARATGNVQRVSAVENDAGGNGNSGKASISRDGRFVVFESVAGNLDPTDENGLSDVFVYHRESSVLERVSADHDASGIDDVWRDARISGDGRFVTYVVGPSSFWPNDGIASSRVFLFDRWESRTHRIDTPRDGGAPNEESIDIAISSDGRTVAFASLASNLVSADTNGTSDVFVQPNPAGQDDPYVLDLFAGQILEDIDFAVAPQPGRIGGYFFQDMIPNGIRDPGEPAFVNAIVFLDANGNGRLDEGERSTTTDRDGLYAFADLQAETSYTIVAVPPSGWEQVLPTADNKGVWRVFLPAGQTISGRDFGFREARTSGQSEDGVIEGRLLSVNDATGQPSPDGRGLPNWVVFLDYDGDGARDHDEPQQLSSEDDPTTPEDEAGYYSFTGLGNRPYTVRVIGEQGYLQNTPAGNRFAKDEYEVLLPTRAPGSPESIAVGDFNGDGWPDLAVAVDENEAVSVLINDGHGKFPQPSVMIPLAPHGYDPMALLAADFNRDGVADLAVANNASSTVSILIGFNGTAFDVVRHVPVGRSPTSLAAGDVDRDNDLDLIVTNELDNTLTILRNEINVPGGNQGQFVALGTSLPVGNRPLDVAVGYFNADSYPDLAVANYGTNPDGADLGGVSILLSSGSNAFLPAQEACAVGYGPASLVVGDLDGDNVADLAVANFLTNDVSVCRGLGDGRFTSASFGRLPVGTGPVDIKAADLEGDGDQDLLVVNVTSRNAAILRNRLEQGLFAFEPAETFGVAKFTAGGLMSVDVGKLDEGDTPDIVISSRADREVSVRLNMPAAGAQRVLTTGTGTTAGLDFSFELQNAVPTLDQVADPLPVNEDTGAQTLTLTGITAGDGETQVLTVTPATDNSTLFSTLAVVYTSPASTATLRYTLAGDQHGTAVVTVTVTDAGLDNVLGTALDNKTTSRSFTVTVRPVNDPPTLDPLPAVWSLDQDAALQTVTLTGITAGGGEAQPLRVEATTSDGQLIRDLEVVYIGSGNEATLRFRPAALRYGNALITVTVTDGGLDNNLATVGDNLTLSQVMSVAVAAVSKPPTLDPLGTVTLDEGAAQQTVTLSGITSGGDGAQPLRVTATSDNAGLIPDPTVSYTSPQTTGQLTFRPLAHQHGSAVIAVTVVDGGLDGHPDSRERNDSFSRTFTVTVRSVNDPPVATDDALPSREDTPLEITWATLFQNDADADSPPAGWVVSALAGAVGGTSENDPTRRLVRFVPHPEFSGRGGFGYTLDDGAGGSDTAAVTIEVAAVNDSPVANNDVAATVAGAAVDITWDHLFANDTDADTPAASWSVEAVAEAINGTVVNDPQNRRMRFTPADGFQGLAAFTYTLADGSGGRSAAPVVVRVSTANLPPTAIADEASTTAGEPVDIPWSGLLANDTDPDSPPTGWSVAYLRADKHGATANFDNAQRVRFVPEDEFVGDASFVYAFSDGEGGISEATVTVHVLPSNHPPTEITLSSAVIAENTETTAPVAIGKLAAVDTDIADQHVYSLVAGAGDADNGLFQISTDQLQIKAGVTLDHEAQGLYSIRVQASDGAAAFQKAFTILVTDVNEFAPVIDPQTLHVREHAVYGFPVGIVAAHDGDTSQSLRFAITGGNAGGAFAIMPITGEVVVVDGGQLDHESQPQYTLTISATDNGQPARTGTGTVTVLVDDVNEPPIFLTVLERVEGESVGILPAEDLDAGDTLSFVVREDPRFEVVAGRLKLKAGTSLDRTAAAVLNLQITATDGGEPPLSRTQNFVLNVLTNPHPWQNSVQANDVTGEGEVQPQDALLLINEINRRSVGGATTQLPATRPAAALYLDPNADDTITPSDVLNVINEINRRAGGGEGEGVAALGSGGLELPLAHISRGLAFTEGWEEPPRRGSQQIAEKSDASPLGPPRARHDGFATTPSRLENERAQPDPRDTVESAEVPDDSATSWAIHLEDVLSDILSAVSVDKAKAHTPHST